MKIYCEVDGKRYEIVPWIACDKEHCSLFSKKLCNGTLEELACSKGKFLRLYKTLSAIIENGYALKELNNEAS